VMSLFFIGLIPHKEGARPVIDIDTNDLISFTPHCLLSLKR
jgi:hypothetical protein